MERGGKGGKKMTLTPTEVAEIKIAVLERDAIIKKLQSEIAIIREKSDIEPKQLFTDNIDISLKKTTKKQIISAAMRKLVWNMNIGEEIGKSKCLCCKVTYITQMSFHCGHIIAESQGGETIVSNLRPICQNCNSSMATKNMDDFIKTLK